MMEYYIYNIPVFVMGKPQESVNIPSFCQNVEELLPVRLLRNVEVVYIGNFKDLRGKNAAFDSDSIYMSLEEPTNFDMLENFIHEVGHSLAVDQGWQIYDDRLTSEFLSKRKRLRSMLESEGFEIDPLLYDSTEYSKEFDYFLAKEVGYPLLLNLTMGLFVSPYGATSLREYFANGFEKYFLDSPQVVNKISPVLYSKIESILDDEA